MDYTLSNSFDTDAGTGQRMHEDAKAIPTVVSGKDMNSLIWSDMELVKAAGLAGIQFDKANPASYQVILKALRAIFGGSVTSVTAPGATALTSANAGLVLVSAALGAVTINLPPVGAPLGMPFQFVRLDNTPANSVTINRAGADTIDGVLTSFQLFQQFDRRHIKSNGVGTWYTTDTSLGAQASGIVGSTRNLRAAQTVASSSLVITADEIVTQPALGGNRFCISGFNKTLNVATVGAGGMDVGAAPASGWVAMYAIANPATGANHVVGVNATAAVAPEVYGGANMPAGYTHSALIGVWPTTAGSLLAIARQFDREVYYFKNLYSGPGTSSAFTLLSIAGAVPKNAVRWKGNVAMASSADAAISTAVGPTNLGQGTPGYVAQQSYAAAGATVGGTYPDCPIVTAQTTYFATSASSGTGTFTINCYGYTF